MPYCHSWTHSWARSLAIGPAGRKLWSCAILTLGKDVIWGEPDDDRAPRRGPAVGAQARPVVAGPDPVRGAALRADHPAGDVARLLQLRRPGRHLHAGELCPACHRSDLRRSADHDRDHRDLLERRLLRLRGPDGLAG